MKSRPTVLSSAVLALALLGDSLLYAILPVHAATFGISLPWVGVLLAANRIIRLFVYPLLADVAASTGLRRFTIAAAMLGAVSTLWFGAVSGGWPLLAARVVWGIAFGSLSLATLAYATLTADGAGTRIGLSLSLRELGPIASLTGGMLLVTQHGVRATLVALGVVSMLAVPLAMLLPDRQAGARSEQGAPQGVRKRQLTRHEVASAIIGLVADGMFPATIALLLVPSAGVAGATLAAGTLLSVKRAAVVVLSPISGRAADRFGVCAATTWGVAATAAGALLIACNSIVAGAIVLISGAAVASTSIPLAAAADDAQQRLPAIARLGVARDAGAAAGTLVAMALFEVAGPSLLYAAAGVLLVTTVVRAWPTGAAARTACAPARGRWASHVLDVNQ